MASAASVAGDTISTDSSDDSTIIHMLNRTNFLCHREVKDEKKIACA